MGTCVLVPTNFGEPIKPYSNQHNEIFDYKEGRIGKIMPNKKVFPCSLKQIFSVAIQNVVTKYKYCLRISTRNPGPISICIPPAWQIMPIK